ncbi:LuxR C-terminal-related transcriptional regulator [Streptomyces sediminimaris]|uniref:LuxR C-terminal-related transcriptional regulator n=1 Tax=Streptomyces sediminimaris TaxID=3383721 RepID=UPI00399B2E2A
MTSSVPAFKLQPQPQPPHLLTRPRLLRRLDEATEPVLVLSAPAGAGKTALLTEWSRGARARGACAWLSLDTHDNAPDRLWAGILHTLHRARPELPVRLDDGEWAVAARLGETLPALVSGLGAAEPLTLILDGLECITDPDAAGSLADFLTRLPPGLRVVVSTRHVPGRPFPALRARALIAELDQGDLAFTPGEAGALLTSLAGAVPSATASAAVYEATEGWAAGLCIMGRALARGADEAGTEESMARGGRAVTEYLAGEVFDRLTTEQRRFLLRTSVLQELSAGPCRALAGDRAVTLLRELSRTVQLLVPVAAEPPTYRRHRALSSLLAGLLASQGADRVAALHRSAAQWYSRQGRTTEAVRHWMLGGDESAAVASVLGAWEETLSAGRGEQVAQWLELLPHRTVAGDARLCVVSAMAALAAGAPETACRWLEVARLRRTGPQTVGEGSTVDAAADVAQAMACCLKGQVLAADRIGASAAAGTLPLTSWRALLCTARGAALLWTGRLGEAEELLGEATRDAHAAGHALALVRALGLRTLCALLAGHADLARVLGDEALAEITAVGLDRHFVAVPAYVGRAGVYLRDGKVEEAGRMLDAMDAALAGSPRADGEPHVCALGHFTRSVLERARGDTDAVHKARDAAQRAAARCESPGILAGLLARSGPRSPAPPAAPRPQDLSAGERRVLRALCGTLTLREIAAELYVSHNTVKTQVRAIFRKLGAHDRSEAVARARQCGVL